MIDAYIMRKGEKKNELWKLKKKLVHIVGLTYLYLEQGRCKKGNWVGLKNNYQVKIDATGNAESALQAQTKHDQHGNFIQELFSKSDYEHDPLF